MRKLFNSISHDVLIKDFYNKIVDKRDRRFLLYAGLEFNDEVLAILPGVSIEEVLLSNFEKLLEINEKIENDYIQVIIKEKVKALYQTEETYIDSYFDNRINNKIIISKTTDEKLKKLINSEINKELCGVFKNMGTILYENNTIHSVISKFFIEKSNELKIKSCYYCNIDFINVYKEAGSKKYHFTLDHVLPKSKYPYFSISLFNLVPSCYTCNSKLKLANEFSINNDLAKICPSSKGFNFDENTMFTLEFNVKDPDFKNKIEKVHQIEDVIIDLKNKYSNNGVKEFIDTFDLQGRYEYHKNICFDLIDKRKKYPDKEISNIAKLIKRDILTVKKDIFSAEIFESTNAPFEKYKQDIAEQLGII
ncbi:HNH endonuclease [Chryseobacterium polytrichastri]|uniref:HNH endonuclease n=1 Tax=Chryseobacterium polytrichastri TaxID=1302687 RepID=A0A1M7CMV9_9FLAO|nr:hypothetical protein [Chryseobacterium polytrichastri]SHL68628.1 hypothetical protein SAMN05444267_102281 [Chryseobacterium polytrichastri]